MMKDDKTLARVTSFLANEYTKSLGKISIFRNDDGSYEFFNRYSIVERNNRYEISLLNQDKVTIFSSLKHAVTWCIHDNINKLADATRIHYLDTLIAGTEISIEMHKKMLKRSKDVEHTLIHLAKLNEEKIKRSLMLSEMDTFIHSAKYLQTKNFIRKDK